MENYAEEEKQSSLLKIIFGFLFFVIVVLMLFFYWMAPFKTFNLEFEQPNGNFSINTLEKEMQFYKNMRYPSSKISYRISKNCTLKKRNDMEGAMKILEEQTVLEFYPVNNNEEIFVTCDDKIHFQGDAFIAGEGGPTNITKTKNFNVIFKGQVLLIEKSKCEKPNVALHELLHALGFTHSQNPNNIMYPITKCSQTLGKDIPQLINELYSYSTYPDLTLEKASAIIHGKYLDLNLTIKNNGLKKSGKTNILIYADNELEKILEIEGIEVGYGRELFFKNIWLSKRDFSEIKIKLSSKESDLNLKDNEIILKIKNKK